MPRLFLWLSATVLAAGACTDRAGEPLRLGALASDQARQAVELAVDQVNQIGGVGGEPIDLVSVDPGAGAGAGRAAARELAGEQPAVVVIDTGNPERDTEAASWLSDRHVTQVGPSIPPGSSSFRLTPPLGTEAAALARLVADHGLLSAMVVTESPQDPEAEAFSAAFQAEGGSVLDLLTYHADSSDAGIGGLTTGNPEAVVCFCSGEEGAALLRAAFAAGALDRPWYYPGEAKEGGLSALAFPDDPGRLAGQQGVRIAASPAPGFDRFVSAFQQAFGSEPNPATAHAYDAALLIALAAEAGEPNTSSITEHMAGVSQGGEPCIGPDCLALAASGADLDYQGAGGPGDLEPSGDPAGVTIEVWRFTLDGVTEAVDSYRL